MIARPDIASLTPELVFTTSRSSGPGGQNVNKVNSKVTLRFDVIHSAVLTDEQRATILERLAKYITKEGELVLQGNEERSQLQNKELVIRRFDGLLTSAFAVRKKRKATKPKKSAIEKRIGAKKRNADKKKWRQRPD